MVNTKQTTIKSHKLRTFFASIFGIIAVGLIMASVTVLWLNRTLTDTNTYVNTVAPLVTKPAIQNFISQKVAEQLLNSAPSQDLAKTLLPAGQVTPGMQDDQLKALLKPVIESNVLGIIRSAQFAALWKDTNRSVHSSLVSQLDNGYVDQLTLDLSPAINGVIAQLKTTQLSPIANKINMKPGTGVISIKSDKITRIRKYFKLFQTGTMAIVIAALAALAIAVLLSVHHGKTVRRILIGVGILALLQTSILASPGFVTVPGTDQTTQAAVKAMIQALVQNLLIASAIVSAVCIAAVIGSKLYSKYRH